MRVLERVCPFCWAYDRRRRESVRANFEHCASRREALLKLGYDQEAAVRFVTGSAGYLEGPILDVGTGAGHCAVAIAKLGHSLMTIDTDGAQIGKAKLFAEHYGVVDKIVFRKRPADAMGFAPASFASIISYNALHHFEKPYEVIDELWRLLRPGGVLIVSDLDETGFAAVEKMHVAEGKTHPRLGATVTEAAAHAGALQGCSASRRQGAHQDVLIMRKST
ncbi:MAG TPA: class I SAM-dependent methyltransferase [bacterium]|nr:class I SAM-dependent methyltransferase [bacterium]